MEINARDGKPPERGFHPNPSQPDQVRKQDHGTSGAERLMVTLLCAAIAIFSIMESSLVPAIPTLQEAVGASTSEISWVLTGLLLSGAVTLAVVGRLGDIYGARPVLITVLGLLCAGLAIAPFAHSILVLAIAVVLQGIGIGIFPLAVALVRHSLPDHRVGTVIGLMIGLGATGNGAGLLVSGTIVGNLGWQWLFGLPLVVLLFITALCWLLPTTALQRSVRVDWTGAVLLGLGLVCLLLSLTFVSSQGWLSVAVLGLGCAGLVIILCWAFVELRLPQPLVDLRSIRRPAVLTAYGAAAIIGFATFSGIVLIPIIMALPTETGFGLAASITAVGLAMLPFGIAALLASSVASRLDRRFGRWTATVSGLGALAGGLLFLAVAHHAYWHIVVATAVVGAGTGLGVTGTTTNVVSMVGSHETGTATALALITRNIGGSVGAQVGATVLASFADPATSLPTDGGVSVAFVVAAAAAVLGMAFCLAVGRRCIAETA
ncbi:MFS transporter [Lentzea sp. NPDC051208]|uniref:MFS transporter n=1 Tax=Lentzea sp. NPDC051208 TaxID=3154642 RepID=UPI00342B94BF